METMQPLTIRFTPKAIAKARELLQKSGVPEGGVRVGLVGGGCSGYTYRIQAEAAPRPQDHIFEFEGVRVFVDPKSLKLLNGSTVDYHESLMYSGFAFHNPNAKRTCGCGSSFSV